MTIHEAKQFNVEARQLCESRTTERVSECYVRLEQLTPSMATAAAMSATAAVASPIAVTQARQYTTLLSKT